MFGAVFAPASDVRFDNVSAVLVVFGSLSQYVGGLILGRKGEGGFGWSGWLSERDIYQEGHHAVLFDPYLEKQ